MNMSYCRCRNTLHDLNDVANSLGMNDCEVAQTSAEERSALEKLVALCAEIAEWCEDGIPEPDAPVLCSHCGDTIQAGLVDEDTRCEECVNDDS